MSAYSELIKNFEKIRMYMRDFYVYGFKSRDEYQAKSARSYDDERRRIESWLGEHTGFIRTPEGKNVFISIDSRTISHNPLYNALKAKCFTDGDITLHFIIFDILHEPSVRRTLGEIRDEIDTKYLCGFKNPMLFDESTLRKKLKEYCEAGIIVSEKEGRRVYYHRAESIEVSELSDVLHYFSEVAPCGAVGSFLLDKARPQGEAFAFKHHYITSAIDSNVLCDIFIAMREKRMLSALNLSRRSDKPKRITVIPLRVFISVQSGRQHLLAYQPRDNTFCSYRIDYLSEVRVGEIAPEFDELRKTLCDMQGNMWGVNIKRRGRMPKELEHVEFTVKVGKNEQYIVSRLEREKRVGRVERLSDGVYRFSADVYDSNEMLPWIRTFIGRIISVRFSNSAIECRFKKDLEAMYKLYGIKKGVRK